MGTFIFMVLIKKKQEKHLGKFKPLRRKKNNLRVGSYIFEENPRIYVFSSRVPSSPKDKSSSRCSTLSVQLAFRKKKKHKNHKTSIYTHVHAQERLSS